MCDMGSGADRQIAVWENSHDTKNVVDFIIEETHIGLDENI
jgi:carboxylate-amine ligase